MQRLYNILSCSNQLPTLRALCKTVRYTLFMFFGSLFVYAGLYLFDVFEAFKLSFVIGLFMVFLGISVFFFVDETNIDDNKQQVEGWAGFFQVLFVTRRGFLLLLSLTIGFSVYATILMLSNMFVIERVGENGMSIKYAGLNINRLVINPQESWINTGIKLKKEEKIKIEVYGKVSVGASMNDGQAKFNKFAEENSKLLQQSLIKQGNQCDSRQVWVDLFWDLTATLDKISENCGKKNKNITDCLETDTDPLKEFAKIFETSKFDKYGCLAVALGLSSPSKSEKSITVTEGGLNNLKTLLKGSSPEHNNTSNNEPKYLLEWLLKQREKVARYKNDAVWEFVGLDGYSDTTYKKLNDLLQFGLPDNGNAYDVKKDVGMSIVGLRHGILVAAVIPKNEKPQNHLLWHPMAQQNNEGRLSEQLLKPDDATRYCYKNENKKDEGLNDKCSFKDSEREYLKYFQINTSPTNYTTENDGELWMVVNDSDCCRGDNGGFYIVNIYTGKV